MPESPLVSCLMAVHNAERYLLEAIRSIQHQTLRDIELIVVDDGSTDRTPRLLAELAAQDPRIRVVRQDNQGLTRSLNRAAAYARGSLLARMDADDIAAADRFEKQVNFLSSHASCAVVGSSVWLIDPDGERLAVQPAAESHEAILAQLLTGCGAIPHPTAMLRREVFEQVGGYRDSFAAAQDLDLWLRIAESHRLANLPEPLLEYRLHIESVTSRRRETQLACATRAVREALARRGDPAAETFELVQGAPANRARTLRGWSRMALKSGSIATARKHALEAFRERPFAPGHWWLLARAYFRRSTPAVVEMPILAADQQLGPAVPIPVHHRRAG